MGFWRRHKQALWFGPRAWLSWVHLSAFRREEALQHLGELPTHCLGGWLCSDSPGLLPQPNLLSWPGTAWLGPPPAHLAIRSQRARAFCHCVGSLLQETPPLGVFAYFSPQSCQSFLKKLSTFLVFPAALGEPLPADVGGFGAGSLVRLVGVTLKSQVDFCLRLHVLSVLRACRGYKCTTKSRQRSDLVCSSQRKALVPLFSLNRHQ